MDLIELLIKNLGVNHTQAMGGAGLIFQVAKDKLNSSDFSEIAKHVTGIEDILASAPKTGGFLGKVGGLASGLGSGGEKLAVISKLGAGFSKLDLGSDMAMKFFPVFESYFREKNDDAVNSIIDKVLGKMG